MLVYRLRSGWYVSHASHPGLKVLMETGMGALADIFLACYPVYVIGRLQQMRLSVKVGLCLLMSGGVMSVLVLPGIYAYFC
jgi:hypothetical protein